MKFPSIKTLAESAGKTIKRFPFEILFALTGTIAATVDIEHDKYNDSTIYWCHRIMMGANLGLLLCLATTLYLESRHLTKQKAWAIRVIAALAGAGLIFLIDPEKHAIDTQRFFLFSLGFHLLVSFSAFISSKNNIQAFWQFNKTLFLRFLAGVLYTAVLYLGLIAAISATEYLFNLHPNEHIYGLLFAWLAGMFNTIFFLAGVPLNLDALENDTSYPKGLQYVLIPLATIYVLILLAYEIKILVTWNLPKGLVSNLILGYAVFGILSILLIYPIREHEGNRWMKTYSKSFYFLLVPLIILLLLSVFARVLPYGITEERYFLLVLSGWLIFITGYFLLSRKQNIKVIPVTLCIVTLLSIYGPQSAFSISYYSQRSILIGIFQKYGLFKDGKLVPAGNKKMKADDGKEATAKLRYLIDGNGMQELQPYVSRDLKAVADSLRKRSGFSLAENRYSAYTRSTEANWVIAYLGVDQFESDRWANSISYDFDTGDDAAVDIKGYDVMLPVNDQQFNFNQTDTVKLNNITIRKVLDSLYNSKLYLGDRMVLFNMKQIADSLIEHKIIKPYEPGNGTRDYWKANKMIMVQRNAPGITAIFAIGKMDISYNSKKALTVSDIKGYYLLKKE